MSNLFKSALKNSNTKTTKKNEKIKVEIKDLEFFKKVNEFEVLQEEIKRNKAKADVISEDLKNIAKNEWIKLYNKTGKNPNSIILESKNEFGEIAQLMFVPTDKYISIDEDRANELRKEFGDDIVEEKVTFSFDNEMLEKYGEILSKLILECDEIDENDKKKIIKATKVYEISKGTINRLNEYGDIETVLENVKPILSLKNVQVIKD